MLSEKAITEFKEIWREVHGEILSQEKALTEAYKLLKLISVVYKPIPKKNE